MSKVEIDPESACGTPKGYSRHTYLGEEACQACKAAHAARVRAYRAEHGRRDQLVMKARRRAVNRLAKEHPERLRELYEQAKAEVFDEARKADG